MSMKTPRPSNAPGEFIKRFIIHARASAARINCAAVSSAWTYACVCVMVAVSHVRCGCCNLIKNQTRMLRIYLYISTTEYPSK